MIISGVLISIWAVLGISEPEFTLRAAKINPVGRDGGLLVLALITGVCISLYGYYKYRIYTV